MAENKDVPSAIGKYKITAEIARGGMGVVYKSHHSVLDRDVVIKKMLAKGSKEEKERFTREAKILYEMQSPYIVKFLDTFDEGRYRYIVEEFVDGIALDKLLEKQTKLPCEVAMLILRDVCYALDFAHLRSVIHRDIKPGNVLISKRAEIKLTDFGIGRMEKEEGSDVTRSGSVLGTPAYMPPEQFDDSSTVDARADIYALGVMLYVMVTGEKPYPSDLSLETLTLVKRGKYTPPKKIDNTLPPVVCRLISKMMMPLAAHRFQSVRPIIKACKKYLRHYDTHAIRVEIARAVIYATGKGKTASSQYEFKPFVHKSTRVRKAMLFACIIAAASGGIAYLWQEGYIYKTLLRAFYTPVDVRMQLPASRLKGADLPIKAFFFESAKHTKVTDAKAEGDGFVEAAHSEREFSALPLDGDGEKEDVATKTYCIKSVYLRHGDYRVKVAAGPYLWWKSFKVGRDGVLLECSILKGASRPLSICTFAYDYESGADITKKCTFKVLQGGKWQRLEAAAANGLMVSGQVQKIKVSCTGYKDEVFSLLLDWYQDELYISASLMRE